MNSPDSASDLAAAYDRLHPTVRKWIRDQGWEELREVQARTILAVLDGQADVVVAAATAAGKTEAAFLPVLTRIADRKEPGFSVVYVSPLKALINDQFRRLDELCERMEIEVVRWHGDAPVSAKKRALERPKGVALITPESIEAMLCRRPQEAVRLLGAIDFVVVDEVHSFMQGPRGLHLASLLRRIEAFSGTKSRRIGLSATIGDLGAAARWLRPADPANVEIIETRSDQPELLLQIKGYVEPPEVSDADAAEGETPGEQRLAIDVISDHLFKVLRGENNLVFGGSRRTVEATADRLRRRAEAANVPNEFFPHHGSLSKVLREDLEQRLKIGNLPTTAVTTSALELGIDIGSVKSVAQIGSPRSLASLRQRLGRTGRRRGVPAVLRIYVREPNIEREPNLLDRLRPQMIRAVAAVRLLLQGFVEPPGVPAETASTLLHQTLAVIGQRGGARADALYRLLCGPGPFSVVARGDYVDLLRAMGDPEVRLIEQAPDGTLMLGSLGEQVFQSRTFYAVFDSPEEWRLTSGGRTLGNLPISYPVYKDSLVVFAGRRWIVQEIDERSNTLVVAPHSGGVVPKFERLYSEPAHDRLAEEMRSVYLAVDVPPYLDEAARGLLAEGRRTFLIEGCGEDVVVREEADLHLFTWRGSQTNAVFGAVLAMAGLEAEAHDFGLTLPGTDETGIVPLLEQIAGMTLDPAEVASFVVNIQRGRFSEYVPRSVAERLWAQQNTELIAGIPALAGKLCASQST
jgi:ATP-dependent Lhr-like helicase